MGYKIRGNTLYVTGTVDGKHYRLSTGKEATPMNEKWIAKNHRDVLLKLIDKEKPNRSEMFKEYALNSLEANAYSVKKSTQYSYESMLNSRILPFFKNYRLDEIKPSDIKAFQTHLLKTMDARSAKNFRLLLSKIMEDALMDDIIEKNPVKKVKSPKYIPNEDIIPFSMGEVKQLLDSASDFMRTFLSVAFFTGMRSGELIALKWEDIDFNSNKIMVRRSIRQGVEGGTKTGKIRIIDMLQPVRDALKEQYKRNGLSGGYIFTTRKGTPYKESGSVTATHWKPLLKRCTMAYRVLYNTRHTFATLMLKNGEDVLWVSKMLGHADVSTTMRYYIKFVEEKGQKRAEFLDEMFAKNRTLSAHSEIIKEKRA